jgi:hypothetical protein
MGCRDKCGRQALDGCAAATAEFGKLPERLQTVQNYNNYSFSNLPLSWHWGHFCGLQRPSLVYPQVVHFHVAINNFLRFISCAVEIGEQ